MKKAFLFLYLFLAAHLIFAQYSFDQNKLMLDLKTLSSDDFQGRRTGTEGNKKAQELLFQRLKELSVTPFTPDYSQLFSFTQNFGMVEQVRGNNILGVIPGTKKETIVISAHYDHVGVNNNEIYNGADDNASGVAALLAMMNYFKKNPLSHRIIIAFFDAEEKGLKGSAHFVNSLDLEKEKIVLNINIDMIGRSDKNTLYACGGYHYPNVKKILEGVKLPTEITLGYGHDDPILKRNDWTNQSDHYNFHVKKIPFVYFGVEDHADYHRPTDDFEKINQVFFSNSVETILQSVKALDKELQ